MTAVDHAELKRAEALLESRCKAIDLHYSRFPDSADRTMEDTATAIRLVLSEIEGLKARIKCLEKLGGEQSLRVMEQATRAKDAENALATLRTQAPDSWRPSNAEVANVLRSCDAMERAIERRGLPKSEADVCVSTEWLRKACAALRPQTAESGK